MTNETPKREGIWALSREERWQLAHALLQRGDASSDAKTSFRRAYPTAPDQMINTATFHVYVDGPDAVISWLADAELFLRDPEHRLCEGVTSNLLYHVYNWHQFRELLPDGKSGVLELLKELRELADEGSLEAVQATAKQLEEMFEGNVDCPDFEFP
jgi:hypothetical protein